MISFRYHLVSIVAVLLALSLGVLVGASVLDKGLVQTLKDDTAEAQARADQLQEDLRVLEAQQEAAEEELLPFVLGGRLAGDRVVVVAAETAPEEVLVGARRALDAAGADVTGVLMVGARVAAATQEDAAALAEVLNVGELSPSELSAAAARALGARLAGATPRGGGGGDVLSRLIEAGFLCSRGCPGVTDDVVAELGEGELVVVLWGADGTSEPSPEDFAVPLVEELVQRGAEVAAGEGAASDDFVTELRSGGGPASGDRPAIVTVDDVDLPLGGVALVLGLERLDLTGVGGNFGPDDGYFPQAA